jgi:hypothetical protein
MCFTFEAFATFRVIRNVLRKNLDGDGTIQARINRAIDLAHAACADERLDIVHTEGAPDKRAGCGRLMVNTVRVQHPREEPEMDPPGWSLDEVFCSRLIHEQRLDFPAQRLIAAAGLV